MPASQYSALRFASSLALLLMTGTMVLGQDKQPAPQEPIVGPVDLALSCPNAEYSDPQPYRLFLPSQYDGTTKVPLLVALHGTGGNHNKYFDHPGYGEGIYQREAEKHGFAVLCPLGTDLHIASNHVGATEWRGLGEHSVFMAIEDVCQRFLIDEDRIICSGQSMGGSGTSYLCQRYPDFFAAGIPLASSYNHFTLLHNLKHCPILFVQGAQDWPVYANDGPIPMTKQLKELGYDAELWMVPETGHNTMKVSTGRVFQWASQQRLVKHPQHVTHRAYLPIHGRAFWTEIQGIENLGYFAEIDAKIESGNKIALTLRNTTDVAIRPEPELLDLSSPIIVTVDGHQVFQGTCDIDHEIQLTKTQDGWNATLADRTPRSRTAYRTHPIGVIVNPPTFDGEGESSMGNWTCDMIRDITDADIAIMNKGHFRGAPLRPNQPIHLVDLLNIIRPSQRQLVQFEISGADLLKILELNILDDLSKRKLNLIQVSGCQYKYDISKAYGSRIVETDVEADRNYRVACESHTLTRPDRVVLGDLRETIEYQWLEPTTISAAWRYIVKCGGKMDGKLDGRIQQVTSSSP